MIMYDKLLQYNIRIPQKCEKHEITVIFLWFYKKESYSIYLPSPASRLAECVVAIPCITQSPR